MSEEKQKSSLFRQKIEDENYEHDAKLNRGLDAFLMPLIKIVAVFAIVAGIVILVVFWRWVLNWIW